MDNSRRSLLKKAAAAMVAFPILNQRSTSPAWAQVPTTAIDEASPQAQALGYYHDASKVDHTKWARKAGPDGATMKCANCQLLMSHGLKADGKEGAWGQCALFPTGLVNENGWCNSWVQKQGA